MKQLREDLWLALVAHLQSANHWMMLAIDACPQPHHHCPR
jgi:hypothetical protein